MQDTDTREDFVKSIRGLCCDGRLTTSAPEYADGYMWVTNGHILFRWPASITDGLTPLDQKKLDAYRRVFSLHDYSKVQFSEPPARKLDVQFADCEVCGGINTPSPDNVDEDGDCIACGGVGVYVFRAIEHICGTTISALYANWLRKFPGVKVAIELRESFFRGQDAAKKCKALLFTFDGGGEGILLPVATRESIPSPDENASAA